jgi:hypothetical protein
VIVDLYFFLIFLLVAVLFAFLYVLWPTIENTRICYRIWVWFWKRRKIRKW